MLYLLKELKNKMTEKIKILLHHNYLKIIKDDGKPFFLPIRCAKIIKDMYNLRNATNEDNDLRHYSETQGKNPEYNVSVFVMNAKHNSLLRWINKIIKPIEFREM